MPIFTHYSSAKWVLSEWVQYSLWIQSDILWVSKCKDFAFLALCLGLDPETKLHLFQRSVKVKILEWWALCNTCFSHTVLPFPSPLSSFLLDTLGDPFSVCLINPFLAFHIVFQSFLYITVCYCIYLFCTACLPLPCLSSFCFKPCGLPGLLSGCWMLCCFSAFWRESFHFGFWFCCSGLEYILDVLYHKMVIMLF